MLKPIIAGVLMASLSGGALADPQAGAGPLKGGPAQKADLVMIQSGADLYDRCSALQVILKTGKPDAKDGALKADACLSYVHGFLDGEQITALVEAMRLSGGTAQTADATGSSAFCVPGQLQQSDVVKSILAYLLRHPEQLSKSVALATYSALEDAYPCLPKH